MYTVEYGGKTLYDPRNSDLSISDAKASFEANRAGTLTLTVPPTNPLYGTFNIMSCEEEIVLLEDGEELFRGRIKRSERDSQNCETLECEDQLAYLNDSILRPYGTYESGEWTNVAPRNTCELFEWYIKQHNLQVEATKQFVVSANECTEGEITRSSTQYPSVGQEIKDKLLESNIGFIRAHKDDKLRYVEMITADDMNNGQRIEFGVNLIDFVDEFEADDLITAIIPVGDNNLMLDGSLDGVYQLGHIKGDTVTLDEAVRLRGIICEKRSYEVSTQEGLANAALEDLKNAHKPIESLTVRAIDLHKLEPHVKPLRLYDWVRVTAKPYDVDRWMMVVKCELDIMNPSNCKYTLGSTKPTLTNQTRVSQRNLEIALDNGIHAVTALTEEAKASAIRIGEEAKASIEETKTQLGENIVQAKGEALDAAADAKADAEVASKGADDYLAKSENSFTLGINDEPAFTTEYDGVTTNIHLGVNRPLDRVEDAQFYDYPLDGKPTLIDPEISRLNKKLSECLFETGIPDPLPINQMSVNHEDGFDVIWYTELHGISGGDFYDYGSEPRFLLIVSETGDVYKYFSPATANADRLQMHSLENYLICSYSDEDGKTHSMRVTLKQEYVRVNDKLLYRINCDSWWETEPQMGEIDHSIFTFIEIDVTQINSTEVALPCVQLNIPDQVSINFCPFPVGSVLHMVESTDPNYLYPNTHWERMQGKFLLGASDTHPLGEVGGEEFHTLSANEMPAHSHGVYYNGHFTIGSWGGSGTSGIPYEASSWGAGYRPAHWFEPGTYNAGGSGSHNNMPPYEVVYMWKRTV